MGSSGSDPFSIDNLIRIYLKTPKIFTLGFHGKIMLHKGHHFFIGNFDAHCCVFESERRN